MEQAEVRQKVFDIITDVALDEDLSNLDDSVALRDQLDLDSMDFLDIVMELKKRHQIEVPQEDYPELLVQDDSLVTFVRDGKFSSSNGNLASYISALELLERMTDTSHRKFVESYLYLDRLKNWKDK